MLTEEKSDIADRLSVAARSWARPDALEHRDPVTEAALMFDALNELNFRRKRVAEFEFLLDRARYILANNAAEGDTTAGALVADINAATAAKW